MRPALPSLTSSLGPRRRARADPSFLLLGGAGVTALSVFKRKYPDYRRADIDSASKRAIEWIKTAQRADGSWYGSWGIVRPSLPPLFIWLAQNLLLTFSPTQCFTYATMFSVESLALAGETYANSEAVRRACVFILGKQMDDGGWGESYKVRLSLSLSLSRCAGPASRRADVRVAVLQSCETEEYVHNAKSQVVNTAWGASPLDLSPAPLLPVRSVSSAVGTTH